MSTVGDYIPHHEPFEYYPSSANPHHLPPTGTIGTTDQANHQYDLSLFYTALQKGELPAVSFLKAPAYADGHPGYSDPLDEQKFVVSTINAIMASDEWKSTAVIILYDDSDGWYDHTMDPVINQSGPTMAQPVDNDDALSTQNTARETCHGRLRRHADNRPLRKHTWPLRVRPTPALAGDLALGQDELRRSPHYRPVLSIAIH